MSNSDFSEAVRAYQSGDHARARRVCERVLKKQPRHFDALYLSGVMAAQGERMTEAVACFERAAAIDARHPAVQAQWGAALQLLERYEEALDRLDRAIQLKSDVAQMHDSRGNILADLERYEEAIESYDRAIALAPDYADAHNDRGVALVKLKRHEEAIASYDRALLLDPGFADAYNNRGVALTAVRRLEEALRNFDRALAIEPGKADFWHGKGVACAAASRPDEAIACYERALALQPEFTDAMHSLSVALLESKQQYAEAAALMQKILLAAPDREFLPGILLVTQLQLCDWREYDNRLRQIESALQSDMKVCPPFNAHLLPLTTALQKKAAVTWKDGATLADPLKVVVPKYGKHPKIRVGYFSPDFRNHPVTHLTAELFEQHDRSQFEITAFSFSPPGSETPARLSTAFDRFIDVGALSDRECVAFARNLELDIAVDLAGYTGYCRPDVFAMRAAPLQMHYIGYLGTMGADFIDYMIADREMIAPQDEQHYTEKIIYLPSYQVNDTKRVISSVTYGRAEWGLPDSGFIYCCFNGCKKINPPMFDVWMRILRQVPDSVLWLHQDNPTQVGNLRHEAANRGVDADRLVFAKPLPLQDYLARYKLADLFLDTLPYNAGATGSDALWAGLPLLTCRGDNFASRYGASMLQALDLPELITGNVQDYEARAVQLGTQPDQLTRVREKLVHGRAHGRLFDIARFTQSLESAYKAIYERHHQGLPPASIAV